MVIKFNNYNVLHFRSNTHKNNDAAHVLNTLLRILPENMQYILDLKVMRFVIVIKTNLMGERQNSYSNKKVVY